SNRTTRPTCGCTATAECQPANAVRMGIAKVFSGAAESRWTGGIRTAIETLALDASRPDIPAVATHSVRKGR
ncbi:MAG: hypothetical protein WAM30_19540, partial [Candidatus Dormiibacterota bacterium]